MKWRILVVSLLCIGLLIWVVSLLRPEPVQVISAKWANSPHADRTSEALALWGDANSAQVPERCAKCHSLYGFLDFLGEDGTAAGSVQNNASSGSVISCNACHNDAAHALSRAVFPSGEEIVDRGPEASCLQCHQGRESTLTVDQAISGLPDDSATGELGFINVHYGVAAATLMGSEAKGAYQYDGQVYAERFQHVRGLSSCTGCHDPHSLLVDARACSPCHHNVVDYRDLESVRMADVDWDGDGDSKEGVADEIDSLHQLLYRTMQDYAKSVIGTPIGYLAGGSLHFFVDTDGDGQLSPDESKFGNRYLEWTPRLVRTAYNYHFVQEDPGSYSHNPSYILQILYDSLRDLSEQVAVDVSVLSRP